MINVASDGYSHCTHSGYEDPESFCPLYHWWADAAGVMRSHWSNYNVAADGIPVIDKRAAVETLEGGAWVFRGPMVDVSLKDGDVDASPMPSEIMAGALAETAFGGLLAEHVEARVQQKPRSGLDSVSIAEYVQGWREHGARIGRAFRNADGTGTIIWE